MNYHRLRSKFFGVLELAPALRKHASALHKYLKGANLYLDYYRRRFQAAGILRTRATLRRYTWICIDMVAFLEYTCIRGDELEQAKVTLFTPEELRIEIDKAAKEGEQ